MITFAEARTRVAERTLPYGYEDADTFNILRRDQDHATNTTYLIDKESGEVQVVNVSTNLGRLKRMRKVGPWPA